MKASDTDTDSDRLTIVVDKYRVLVPKSSLGEDTPKSWREVGRQVNGHLMRLAAGATRLLAEVVESATRLVRGVAGIPASISKRLEAAHDSADYSEGRAQQGSDRSVSAAKAEEEITAILTKYSVKGYLSGVHQSADGRPVIVILRPDANDALDEMKTQKLLEGKAEQSTLDS